MKEFKTIKPTIEDYEKLRDATLIFLIRKSEGEITEICLAMKKRGFGKNRWNGVGGKVEQSDQNIETAAHREAEEEISVKIKQTSKVAELSFFFPHNPSFNQKVHVYFSEAWEGQPMESDEMRPEWFLIKDIPFNEMWSDDKFWLPEALAGKLIKATFVFTENDLVQEQDVQVVDKL